MDEDEFFVFGIGNERYAVPLAIVREVCLPPNLTLLPRVPGFVRGVTNLRGSILAVIDQALALGVSDDSVDGADPSTRLIVLHWEGVDVGLVVSFVDGVSRGEELSPPLDGLSEELRRWCLGTLRCREGLAAVIDPRILDDLRQRLEVVA